MNVRVRFVPVRATIDFVAVLRIVAWAALLIGTLASLAAWGGS